MPPRSASPLAEVYEEPLSAANATPARILDLCRRALEEKKESRRWILHCRNLRRGGLVPVVPPRWRYRRAAGRHVISAMPERTAIEQALLNGLAPKPPVVDRNALGTSDTAKQDAEHLEYYLNELRAQIVPFDALKAKGVEDAEYATLVLPYPLDPFAEPYAIEDENGKLIDNPFWDRDKDGAPKKDGQKNFKRSEVKSSEAFRDALARATQEHKPVSVRLIPALDCAPFLDRGMGAERWELNILVVRTLVTREHAIGRGYRGAWMGGRLLVPQGFGNDYAGEGERLYLYEAMVPYRDEKGRLRPFIAHTIGGAGTWYDGDAPRHADERDADRVAITDLYQEYGIDWIPWDYHWGMHTEDDDPDYYGLPTLRPLANRIHNIELLETLNLVATVNNVYTGHTFKPDRAFSDDVILEKNGGIRKPKVPDMGEVVEAAGDVMPFPQAEIGADAWRMHDNMRMSFEQNKPQDPGASGASTSGHQALVVHDLFETARRHIPDGALKATESILTRALKILCLIEEKHSIRWPLQTKGERPEGLPQDGPVELNPRWIKNNTLVKCRYLEEGNLAEKSLAVDLYLKGLMDFEKLQRVLGEQDAMTVAVKIAAWQSVLGDKLAMDEKVAAYRNDQQQLKKLKLIRQQMLTEGVPGVPGLEDGLPEAAVGPNVPGGGGGRMPGTGLPDMAGAVRGGIVGGQMGQQAAMSDATAQMETSPNGAVV